MLDSFFGSLGQDGCLWREVSDRGFAKARDHVSHSGLQRLSVGNLSAGKLVASTQTLPSGVM